NRALRMPLCSINLVTSIFGMIPPPFRILARAQSKAPGLIHSIIIPSKPTKRKENRQPPRLDGVCRAGIRYLLDRQCSIIKSTKIKIYGGYFMALKLIKGSYEYKEQIIDMLKEWKEYNDTHDTNHSPWAIFKNSFDDFDDYLS